MNYGPRIGEEKGLVGPVLLGKEPVVDWSVCAIDLDRVPRLWDLAPTPVDLSGVGPAAWRAIFEAASGTGLFLDTSQWGKGIAWVNGFCLGRYWRRGPQHTLYVPGPVVREDGNELVVLELEVMPDPTARFVAGPSLGPLEE